MKRYLALLVCLGILLLQADPYLNSSAFRAGVANLNSLANSPIIAYYNPALSYLGISSGFNKPYSFSDIESGNLAYSLKVAHSYLSFGNNYLASTNYLETTTFISYSYKFNKNLKLGVSEKWLYFDDSSKNSLLFTDIGIEVSHNNISLSSSLSNIFNNSTDYNEVPQVFTFECMYKQNNKSSIAIGIEKEEAVSLTPKLGVKYAIYPAFNLLAGYKLNPDSFSTGFNYGYNNLVIAYSVLLHNELNATHFVSLYYALD